MIFYIFILFFFIILYSLSSTTIEHYTSIEEDGPCIDSTTGKWGVRISRYGKSCLSSQDVYGLDINTSQPAGRILQDESTMFVKDMTPCYENKKKLPFFETLCKQHYGNTFGVKQILTCDPHKKKAICAKNYSMGISLDSLGPSITPCRYVQDITTEGDTICKNTYPIIEPIGWKQVYKGKDGGCVNPNGEYDNSYVRYSCDPLYNQGLPRYGNVSTECYIEDNLHKNRNNQEYICKLNYGLQSKVKNIKQTNCPIGLARVECTI
jgi:hypothetical protein